MIKYFQCEYCKECYAVFWGYKYKGLLFCSYRCAIRWQYEHDEGTD